MDNTYKIFRQIQEKEKKKSPYKNYDKDDLLEELIDLQQRIDKAVEYLESLMNSEVFSLERDNNAFEGLDKKQVAKNEVVLSMLKTQTLLDILKGDDTNE